MRRAYKNYKAYCLTSWHGHVSFIEEQAADRFFPFFLNPEKDVFMDGEKEYRVVCNSDFINTDMNCFYVRQ